ALDGRRAHNSAFVCIGGRLTPAGASGERPPPRSGGEGDGKESSSGVSGGRKSSARGSDCLTRRCCRRAGSGSATPRAEGPVRERNRTPCRSAKKKRRIHGCIFSELQRCTIRTWTRCRPSSAVC